MRILFKLSLSLLFSTLLWSSCTTGPQSIKQGTPCVFCKMPISDLRFAAELVTKKGKVMVYDDVHCLLNDFAEKEKQKNIGSIYVANFEKPAELLHVNEAVFLKSDALRSPMTGNVAAFVAENKAKEMMSTFPGHCVIWTQIMP